MDKRVAEYIEKQGSLQREVGERLREIIVKTFPGIREEMRWGVPVYGGGKFYIAAVRHGVNLGLSVQGMSEEEMKNFEGKGKLMRHRKFLEVSEVEEKEVVRWLKMVKDECRCGGGSSGK